MNSVKYRFVSLQDFLTSSYLTVDAQISDGWGARFPVKGREIEASILFCDIASFARRTSSFSPTETLIFVNNFFAWVTAEALRNSHGIIDKYIGDALMIVFSKEFGSEDPFVEAVQAARWMAEYDALAFCPHMGIASGRVIVGHVGTPVRYDCSVFGAPVALAARCANVSPEVKKDDPYGYRASITFPASEWEKRELDAVIPPKQIRNPDGTFFESPHSWKLLNKRTVAPKNLGELEICEIVNTGMYIPSQCADDRARAAYNVITKSPRWWPNA